MATKRKSGKARTRGAKATTTRATKARKAAPRLPEKIEIWRTTEGREQVTVVRAGGITTRIVRKKLYEAMQGIIRDPAARARLEENPAKAMAAMGIRMDDKEKLALKGKRLSDVLARMASGEEARLGVGFFPQTVVENVASVTARVTSQPEANAGVTADATSTATTEVAGEVTAGAAITTGAEETVAVAVVAL